MAGNPEIQEKNDKDEAARAANRGKTKERNAERRAKREVKRGSARHTKAENGKPHHLCSLATVEVKKGNDGFHVSVSGQTGRLLLRTDQIVQVLHDLETAIVVMRSVQ